MAIIVLGDWNNTNPAAPSGYDLAKVQIDRAGLTIEQMLAQGVTPKLNVAVKRATTSEYGTIIYDGSGLATKYLGADGLWHDVPGSSGGSGSIVDENGLAVGRSSGGWQETFKTSDLLVHQGYCTDTYYHYVVDTGAIYKKNYLTWANVATNSSPFTGPSRSYNHLGAPMYYNGKIYIPTEQYPNSCPHGNRAILVYNASDLSFDQEIYGTDIDNNGGMVALTLDQDNGLVYSPDSCEDKKIRVYRFSDWTYQSTITTSLTTADIQGITIHNNVLYIALSNGNLYSVDRSTGTMTLVFTSPYGSYYHEGIDWTQPELRWLIDHSSPGHGYVHMFSPAKLLVGYTTHVEDSSGNLRRFPIELKINDTDAVVPYKLNVKAGTNVTVTDDGAGGAVISSTASGGGLPDATDYVSTVAADTPRAFWYMDETSGTTLADHSGNGYDVTSLGAGITLAYAILRSPLSANPRWGTTYASLPTRSGMVGLSLPYIGDATLEFLILRFSNPSAESIIFSSQVQGVETEAANCQFQVSLLTGGTLQYFHEYGAGNNQNVAGTVVLPTWKVTHVVVRRKASTKTIDFFIGGRLLESGTYTNDPTGGTSAVLSIGEMSKSVLGYMSFWASALTDSQISNHASKAAASFSYL